MGLLQGQLGAQQVCLRSFRDFSPMLLFFRLVASSFTLPSTWLMSRAVWPALLLLLVSPSPGMKEP